MTKAFLFSVISFLLFNGANAATPWWERDTICQLSPSRCYNNMGVGYFYDTEKPASWDITSNCWGKKYICVEALKNSSATEPVPMGRAEIADTSRVSSDFDTNELNGDCFGVRKTSSGGATASVSGNFVKVWCSGILDNPTETLENGEITSGAQTTCAALAANGYVGIQNGKCYGKYYKQSEYFIQCSGETPTLIILNGADPDGATDNIRTKSDADARFNTMYQNAHAQYQIHFAD